MFLMLLLIYFKLHFPTKQACRYREHPVQGAAKWRFVNRDRAKKPIIPFFADSLACIAFRICRKTLSALLKILPRSATYIVHTTLYVGIGVNFGFLPFSEILVV